MSSVKYDKSKFRYKLYAPNKINDDDIGRMGKFHIDDFRGMYASAEFAQRAGSIKKWHQVIDKKTNKVIIERVNQL